MVGTAHPTHLRNRVPPLFCRGEDNEGVSIGFCEPMVTQPITINIPEKILLAEKTDAASFARELPVLAAVKLYELGRLSSGRAADLAGMSRVEFLFCLHQYNVCPFNTEIDDLEQSLASHDF